MYAYLITYDLIYPGRNYIAIERVIKGCSINEICCHPLESVWIIKSALTANQIKEFLIKVTDQNDKFLVAEITKNCDGIMNANDCNFISNNIFI